MGIWDFSRIRTEKEDTRKVIDIVNKEVNSLGAHYNNVIRAYFSRVNNAINKSLEAYADSEMHLEGKTEDEAKLNLADANKLYEEERYAFDIADDRYMFRVFDLYISNVYPIRMVLDSEIFTMVYSTVRDICDCDKSKKQLTINSEVAFIECLGYVLNSMKVQKVIELLLTYNSSEKNYSVKKKKIEEKTVSQVLSIDQLLEGKRIVTLKYAIRIWDIERVDSFIDMVKSSYSEGDYYIGTLVFVNSKENADRLILIDGQSRIITLLLMLSVIDERRKKNNRSLRYANLVVNDVDLHDAICSSIEKDKEYISKEGTKNYRLIRKHISEKLDALLNDLQISVDALNDYLLYDVDFVQIIVSGNSYSIESNEKLYEIINHKEK